jgi:hypothetical protein
MKTVNAVVMHVADKNFFSFLVSSRRKKRGEVVIINDEKQESRTSPLDNDDVPPCRKDQNREVRRVADNDVMFETLNSVGFHCFRQRK